MMSHITYLRNAVLGLLAASIGVALVALLADVVSPDLFAGAFGGHAERITLGMSISATIVNAVPAFLIGYLLVWRRASTSVWYGISLIALVLTGLNSFIGATTIETALWLNVMHFVAAAAIVPAVATQLPASRSTSSTSMRTGTAVTASAS